MPLASVGSNSEASQEWEDQSTDINAVLERVDMLIAAIDEPTPEKLRLWAKNISHADLLVTLQLSIAGLHEWHERYQEADKEATEAISRGMFTAAKQREMTIIRSQVGQQQVVSLAAAASADARRSRMQLVEGIEAMQQARSLTKAIEQLLGRKIVVNRVSRILSKVEKAEDIDHTLGVESIASLEAG